MTNAKSDTRTYHIVDSGMRYVGAHRIRRGQKTIICTPAEAEFFIQNGGLSETDPAETAKELKAAAPAPQPEPPADDTPDPLAVSGDGLAAVAEKPATVAEKHKPAGKAR